jgi:serine/threonine protein phosphatase 1
MQIQNFPINAKGRDFAVGDIHGYFSRLEEALRKVDFDAEADRLFSVGDLIDRGPECTRVLEFLDKPWFHAVRGNHEDYACRYETVDESIWLRNGGAWFMALPTSEQSTIAARLRKLPFCMQVETHRGSIGIVHADVPFNDWAKMQANLHSKKARTFCMWSRKRLETSDDRIVRGVRAVVVGHTPLKKMTLLGNVYHIDTTGWKPDEGGYFTLLDLSTLQTYPACEKAVEQPAS